MVGAPGAGKGTQARSWPSAGPRPRRVGRPVPRPHKREHGAGQAGQEYIERGALVPDDVTSRWSTSGWTSRTPRRASSSTASRARARRPRRSTRMLAAAWQPGGRPALYIDVDRDELVRRLSGRWLCSKLAATTSTTADAARPRCRAVRHRRRRARTSATTTSPRRSAPALEQQLPPMYEVVDHYADQACCSTVDGDQTDRRDVAEHCCLRAIAAAGALKSACSGDRRVTLKSRARSRRWPSPAGWWRTSWMRWQARFAPGVTTIELDRIAEEMIRGGGGIPSFIGVPGGIAPFRHSLCISHRRRGRPRHPRAAAHPRRADRVGRRRRHRRRLARRRRAHVHRGRRP